MSAVPESVAFVIRRSMTAQIDERKVAAGLFELITSNSAPDWFTEQELAVTFD
jgi:hypothetical protein